MHDNLLLLPVGQVVAVKSLKLSNGSSCQAAGEGESVEIGVFGHSDDGIFGVGDILCDPQKPVQIVRKVEKNCIFLWIFFKLSGLLSFELKLLCFSLLALS